MAESDFPFATTLDILGGIVPKHLLPRIGIVCGSGLSTLASSLRDVVEVPYSSLPGFGHSTGQFTMVFIGSQIHTFAAQSLVIRAVWRLGSWGREKVYLW